MAEGYSKSEVFLPERDPNVIVDYTRSLCEVVYEMVNDPSTDSIISWSESGKSFIVWNESEFCRDVLWKHLGLTRFSSFTGMLDLFSISKVEESEHQLEFAHDFLVRGKPELAKSENFVLTTPQSYLDLNERIKKRGLEFREKKKKKEEKKKMKKEEQARSGGLRV